MSHLSDHPGTAQVWYLFGRCIIAGSRPAYFSHYLSGHYLTPPLWPYTPKIDRATWDILALSDMRHDILKDSTFDMRHGRFLNLTGQHGHFLNSTRRH